VLIGRSSDKGGMETGVIEMGVNETGVIETGAIEMLISWRGYGATVVANEDVMLGCSAEHVSSSDEEMSEVEGLMVGLE